MLQLEVVLLIAVQSTSIISLLLLALQVMQIRDHKQFSIRPYRLKTIVPIRDSLVIFPPVLVEFHFCQTKYKVR